MIFSLFACSESDGSLGGIINRDKNNESSNKALEFNYSLGFYQSGEDIFQKYTFSKDNNNYPQSPISVSETDLKEFENYIDSIETKYNYESYYNLNEALDLYNDFSNKKIQHSNQLEDLTTESLMERVKSNNTIYKQSPDLEYTQGFYEEFPDDELKIYCETIINAANFYLKNANHKYKDEVKCVLGDLKIFKRSVTSNAFVSDDNCLIISPNMIEAMKIKDHSGNQNVSAATIAHETMHMLQKGCAHRNEIMYAIGHSYKFEELEVNPLFLNWFYEGSAEKLVLNITGYVPLTYEYYINYINSLSLSVILNKDNYLFQMEESTFDKTYESLYTAFGCETQAEKTEMHNMLFSLDIIETDNEGFVNAYNPEMTDEELVKIKRDLKNSICETMSKYFYKSLAKLIKENDVSLQDVFYMINVFENDVNSHIGFHDEGKCQDAKAFIENYTQIQNEFFEMLAKNNGIEKDEITNMFNSYSFIDSNGNKNYSLSYLSEEKQALFTYVFNATYIGNFENIRNY